MPASAYPVLILFTVVAVLCGIGAAWLVGPRRVLAIVAPTLAAFLALYWVGHKSGLALGPTLDWFGFRIALLQDVVVALVAALAAAGLQRLVLDWRRPRDGSPREAG